MNKSIHVRNIWLDLFLAFITCGIWSARVQSAQIDALNEILTKEQDRLRLYHRYSFWKWACLTLITCGIWHIYHEWRKSQDLAAVFNREKAVDGVIAVILTLTTLPMVADAIQQSFINQYYGDTTI